MTIESAQNEADLAHYEQGHTCNPIRLYQLQEEVFRNRTRVS
jgi:hypothetical protein